MQTDVAVVADPDDEDTDTPMQVRGEGSDLALFRRCAHHAEQLNRAVQEVEDADNPFK